MDVDCIVDVISLVDYHKFESRLIEKGFKKTMEDEVICRFRHEEIMLDVMPTDQKILGFGNLWYKKALKKEACLHIGKISNDDWLPYFSSKAVGDVLMKIAKENSDTEFLVLCGHTHSEAEYRPIHNLIINVGSAEYNKPKIQKII